MAPTIDTGRIAERGWLRLHEAGFVMQVPRRVVRKMLERGEFMDVGPGRRRGIATEELPVWWPTGRWR